MQQMADSQQLRVHIRESGSMEALDHVLRRGYHLALLRYAEEDEDYYHATATVTACTGSR